MMCVNDCCENGNQLKKFVEKNVVFFHQAKQTNEQGVCSVFLRALYLVTLHS